jgi:hypothetical protein
LVAHRFRVGRESSGLPDYRRLGGRRASAGLAMAMVRTPPVCSDFEERVTARLKALVTVLPDGAATFYAGANPNALAKSLFPYFCITPSNPKSAAIRGYVIERQGIDFTIGQATGGGHNPGTGTIRGQTGRSPNSCRQNPGQSCLFPSFPRVSRPADAVET